MENHDSSVNYIKHQCAIHIIFTDDDRLTTSHISLYMAMFQMWNINRFNSPLLIIRSELMQMSKLASKSTYHRTIKELHDFGYLEYFPSKSPMVGSKINMLTIDQIILIQNQVERSTLGQLMELHSSIPEHLTSHEGSKYGHLNEPFNKHINKKKHINLFIPQNEFCETEKNETLFLKKINSEKSKFVPPTLQQVGDYFKEKNKPQLEAEIFFNHYKSNGWKISGKTQIVDWNAAAEKWILSNEKYQLKKSEQSLDHLHTNPDKDYHIPL